MSRRNYTEFILGLFDSMDGMGAGLLVNGVNIPKVFGGSAFGIR